MAGYNEIRGLRVKYLSADPANSEDGQVWYNSTTGNLRVQGIGVAAFSSAAPLATARNSAASFGTQTAGVIGLGATPPGGNSAATEEYNGSGWSTGSNANTARRYLSGFGIETAGVACGGYVTASNNATEEYDGSTWTAGGNLNTARYFLSSAGILTAGVAFGGNAPPFTAATEEYNGTSWTNVNSMSTSRGYLAGTGIQTAALGFGGYAPGNTAATEEYDGTNWTAGGNLNTAKRNVSGGGTLSSGQAFGGFTTTSITSFEEYNGSTWSNSPLTLATARNSAGSLGQPGSEKANLITGGSGATSLTEEYNFSSSTVTAAAWSSGGSRSNYTFRGAGFGSTVDAVSSGGTQTSPLPAGPINNITEVYNGTSWTSGTNAPLNLGYVTAGGTSAAGIVNTGESPPGSGTTTIEYASGTWTSGGTQNYAAQNATGAGTQSSYIQAGGVFQPDYSPKNNADSYDGTTWTTITNYPANISSGGGAGDASTAFFYGGAPSAPVGTLSNDWNGSAWTAAATVPVASRNMNQNNSGPVSGALNAANAATTTCLLYDGTGWSTSPSATNLSPDGMSGAGGNLPTVGLLKWGSPGAASLTVEEFIGEVVTVNPASNLTVS